MGNTCVGQRVRQQIGQPDGVGVQLRVHGVVGRAQRGQPRRHRDGVTRQRARLIHGPSGASLSITSTRPPNAAAGRPPLITLP